MIDYQRLFHTGVRVPDIAESMDELSSGLGVTWAEVQHREQGIWMPDGGFRTVKLEFTYSCEGPQHIELLHGEDGTFWDTVAAPGVHHIGVWVDDVGAETTRLLELGWTLVGASKDPAEGFGAYTYLQRPGGMIVELVWGTLEPMFQRWWAGGTLG